MMSIVERLREKMDKRESLSNDAYWTNMAALLVLTWVVMLYLIQPALLGESAPRYAMWTLLMLSAYSLVIFNELEVIRKKVSKLE